MNQTTERSLLLATQYQQYQTNYSTNVNKVLQYTNENNALILNTLYGELIQLKQARYQPYQPYMPVVIPPSVMQLEMNTVNVGVPHSFLLWQNVKVINLLLQVIQLTIKKNIFFYFCYNFFFTYP